MIDLQKLNSGMTAHTRSRIHFSVLVLVLMKKYLVLSQVDIKHYVVTLYRYNQQDRRR